MLKSGIVNMHSDIKKLDLTILPKPTMREGLKTRRSYMLHPRASRTPAIDSIGAVSQAKALGCGRGKALNFGR